MKREDIKVKVTLRKGDEGYLNGIMV